ncbi:hypothetical protein FPV67DRAFT_1674386 [Lyophyllum atratum]|nr:hypothetical protein FPV67DRAFT_1674386 [Lyophyllum atratum]
MTKSDIPAIPWVADNGKLIWALITELEKPENYKVFCGKKNKHENTSGDSKAKVAKRMAEVIYPEYYKINPRTVGDHVKGKLDALISEYQKHVKRLRKTGKGVGGPEETMPAFFIEGAGPDESTPFEAVNIWDEIVRVWPYFPRLHALYASRPNVTPIAVTGIGPAEPQTEWHQHPDDFIDPVLRTPPHPPATPTAETPNRSFGSDRTKGFEPGTSPPSQLQSFSSQESVGSATRFPRASTASRQVIEKMKAANSTVLKKRSAVELLVEVSKENMKFLQDDARRKQDVHERVQVTTERGQLFQEYTAGIWTVEEFCRKADELSKCTEPPAKRHHEYSLDW